MVKIYAISDLHGHLPKIPDCDLLLLGGDYCIGRGDKAWYEEYFRPWLKELCNRMTVVGIAGNHDCIFEFYPDYPYTFNWNYLHTKTFNFNGLNIWGTPFSPTFGKYWAFNKNEYLLKKEWEKIPTDTDIILVHAPPFGHRDFVTSGLHVGSISLLEKVKEIQPKCLVAGHLHESFGVSQIGNTIVYNVSHCNEFYNPVNLAVEIKLQ